MFEKKLSHLIKRDGSVKDFDANKIVAAIAKAGKATGEFDESRAPESPKSAYCRAWLLSI